MRFAALKEGRYHEFDSEDIDGDAGGAGDLCSDALEGCPEAPAFPKNHHHRVGR